MAAWTIPRSLSNIEPHAARITFASLHADLPASANIHEFRCRFLPNRASLWAKLLEFVLYHECRCGSCPNLARHLVITQDKPCEVYFALVLLPWKRQSRRTISNHSSKPVVLH